jgi:hypothetical protein
MAVDQTSGVTAVHKSQPPSAGTVSWTSVLTMAGTGVIGTMLNATSWTTGTNYLFAGDYADPSGGPSLWRSANGTSWTKVLGPVAGLRHFHAVAGDPYAPGTVYLTAGDGQQKVLARSTDSGATWTWIITDDIVQSVQISFSPEWIYLAGDQGGSVTVWVIDRSRPTVPIIASTNHHTHLAVPGGVAGRGLFTDGVLTASSATFTSATAAFDSTDVGRFLRFLNVSASIANTGGIYITAVNSPTSVTLNKAAGGSQTNRQFMIEGDLYGRAAFFGAVDPATGIYYCVSNDFTSGGNRTGLFYLREVGGRLELLESYHTSTPGEVFFRDGKLWVHQGVHPLLALA